SAWSTGSEAGRKLSRSGSSAAITQPRRTARSVGEVRRIPGAPSRGPAPGAGGRRGPSGRRSAPIASPRRPWVRLSISLLGGSELGFEHEVVARLHPQLGVGRLRDGVFLFHIEADAHGARGAGPSEHLVV